MANTFINPQWVTNDIAEAWVNNITLIGNFDRSWDESWRNKPGGAQIGYTVQARLPQRYVVTEGQAFQPQAIMNQTVPITLNKQFNVAVNYSSADATLALQDVEETITMPAGRALANKCDLFAGKSVYQQVAMFVGSPGVPVTSDQTYTDAVAKLQNMAVPEDFCAVLDPKSQSNILNANFALFNPTAKISEYFNKGQFAGAALGVDDWYYDTNIPMHTTGTFTTSTPVVSGGGQTGSTLSVSGLGTYAFNAGDQFAIVGLDYVNPLGYQDNGEPAQFTILQAISGSSTATLTISPSIITSGQLQTVVSSPANGAALAFQGATGTVSATMAAQNSRQSLLFNPNAFAWVMADLTEDLPGAISKMARSKQAKLTMRWAEQWNIQTDQKGSRVDMIVGAAPVEPYFALRVWS